MPTAILQSERRNKEGNRRIVRETRTITHNNRRLYNERGRTYEYIGNDASGNRIYRDTQPRG